MPDHEHHGTNASEESSVNPMFSRGGETAIPRWRLPDGEMLPDSAYQIIHDEILLDGNARQNLATFVTTWMEPQASQLADIRSSVGYLDSLPSTLPKPVAPTSAFHH